MKKSLCTKIVAIIAMMVIMLAGNSALAYVGDGYSIDIPSTYTSGGDNAWVNATSKSTVNVQVVENTSGETISQSSLQDSIDSLKQSYSGIVIEKSEITKLNGMDALHIVSSVSGMYLEQYAVIGGSKVYVLTLGAMEKSWLSSSEATGIVSSFKVTGASTSGTGTSTGTTNTVNNVINSVNNTINNTTNNTNTDNKITNTDDDDDDEDEKTSKKKSSKSDDDDDEENTWIIVAIVAGVIVFALIAIIIIVAIVVSGKKKQQY